MKKKKAIKIKDVTISIPIFIVLVILALLVLVFDEFNDFYPKGTWKIYIYNRGSAFTDVSTATARITVNYGYDSYS